MPAGPLRSGRRLVRIGLAVLALGLLIALGVGISGEVAVRRDARLVREAIGSGRLDEAKAPLDRWLRARPNSAEAHYCQARLTLAENQPREAEQALQRARSLGLDENRVDRLRGLLLVRSGRLSEAEPLLVGVRERSKEPDPEVDEALARIFLSSYRMRLASIVLDRWTQDAPDDPKPYLWMTEIDRRTNAGPAAAASHYREALKRDPELSKARLGLADALRESNRPAEAAEQYALYLAKNPDDPAGLVGAGRAALLLGKVDAAAGYLDRALAIAPDDPEVLKERAVVDMNRGADTSALERLDRVLALHAYDSEAHYRRSLALSHLGRADEARKAQETSARLRADEARLVKVQEAFNKDPDNPELRLEIARWMFDHGQEAQGVRWTRTVLARDPGHVEANRLLAAYHEKRGETGLANFYRLQATSHTNNGALGSPR